MFILVLLILGLTAQVLTNSFYSINNNHQNDLCPKMCICDSDGGLNRANCSSKHLVSAQINMPKFVEIFDLQWNDITVIENKCFSDLKHLQEINLDNNAIHTIDLNAFARLKYLKNLSLANNRLESFDHRILENAKSLLNLNLSGNKFMNLVNVPLLKSKSLQKIDLHNSKINFLHENTFHELPQLIEIDLSQNLLITLSNSPFIRNNKLKIINLDNNPWNCDENMQKTLRWLTSRKINVTIQGCFITRQMFERMKMLPVDLDKINGSDRNNKTIDNQQQEVVHVDVVWKELRNKYKFLNQICPLNNSEEACNMYEACAVNLSSVYKEIDKQLIQLYETKPKRRKIVTMVSIDAALLAGFIFGTIFGGTFIYLVMMCTERCKENKKARRLIHNGGTESIPTTPTLLLGQSAAAVTVPLQQPPLTTPVTQMTRRSRRRQRRANERESRQIVRDQRSTTFFGSLFDRPVRRRYMRSINENATNLVRRLSQSRLALNLTRTTNSRHNNNNNNQSPGEVISRPSGPPTAPPNADTLPHQRQEYQRVPTIEGSVSSNRFLLGHINGTSHADSLNNREWITASQPNLHQNNNITDEDEDSELYEILIPPTLQRAETPPPAYKDLIK